MKYLIPLMLALAVCLGGCSDRPDPKTEKDSEIATKLRTPPPVKYDEK